MTTRTRPTSPRTSKTSAGRRLKCVHIALAFLSLIACAGCRCVRIGDSSIALPHGEVELGKAAFRSLQCHSCHAVSGHDFPSPSVNPPVWVVLGTEDHAPDRRELVDSIIRPSHKIYPGVDRTLVQTNGISRMPDFSDVQTVRQLSNLVAFLDTLHR